MQVKIIQNAPGFEEWRTQARECLYQGVKPNEVVWQCANDENPMGIFSDLAPATESQTSVLPPPSTLMIPREFMTQAKIAACHRAPDRYNLLYQILWRLAFENKRLLHFETDDAILKLTQLAKAVHRDAYKIKAFLRFREIQQAKQPHFVSWYEPEHYSLELVLPFFQTRFKNMIWTILTPYRSAHWDGTVLRLADAPDKAIYPAFDQIESYWLTYYEHTFNPARIKTKAMLTQMPKKYWKNMPETALISGLLKTAEAKVQKML